MNYKTYGDYDKSKLGVLKQIKSDLLALFKKSKTKTKYQIVSDDFPELGLKDGFLKPKLKYTKTVYGIWDTPSSSSSRKTYLYTTTYPFYYPFNLLYDPLYSPYRVYLYTRLGTYANTVLGVEYLIRTETDMERKDRLEKKLIELKV
jgi:hypothetical protein